MTRPTARKTTRTRLLAAGRRVAIERGLRNLTVRAVAGAARANLGSFVYHFGSRDAFVRTLIEEWYAPLLDRVSDAAAADAGALQRLRSAILQLVDFALDNGTFVGRILMAAADDDRPARDFLHSLSGRHPRVLMQIIARAQAEGALIEEDPMQVLAFLMSSVALPHLVACAWHGPALFNKAFSARMSRIARNRDRMVQRLDWAIRGLTPGDS
jgi:AcrR family transcriptional regulator